MTCLHPSRIKDPRFPKQYPTRYLEVPCNRCMACRIRKTEEWSTRLLYESTQYEESTFITLTYDEEHLPKEGLLVPDFQKFMKRLRKHFPEDRIKYYACGEYGDNWRGHYHAILFGVAFDDWIEYKPKHYYSPTLQELWLFGFNEVGFVNTTTMNYVTGYIQKKQFGKGAEVYEKLGLRPPFQLFSKELGLQFSLDHADQLKRNMFVIQNGSKKPVPKYISKKIGLDVSPTGFASDSPLVKKAQENARKRLLEFRKENAKLTTDPFKDYDDYMWKLNAQRENELAAKDAAFNQRNKNL